VRVDSSYDGELKQLVKKASKRLLSPDYKKTQAGAGGDTRKLHEHEKRNSVVQEILVTERNYLRSLKALVEDYQAPLEQYARAKKKWITEDQVKNMFYQVRVIYGLNSTLLNELEQRTDAKTWKVDSVIGDIFVKMGDFLRVYASYISNYSKASQTLKECKQNKKFVEFLQAVSKNNEKKSQSVGFELNNLLITPVQRIPRYIMLLKMLLQYTSKEHPDNALIKEAIRKIERVANDNEKSHETTIQLAQLFQIQKRFSPSSEVTSLVDPHRKYLYEAEAEVQHLNEKVFSKPKIRQLIICNDIIIFAKCPKKEKQRDKKEDKTEEDLEGGTWSFLFQLEMEYCKVELLEDIYDFISSKHTQKNALKLTYTNPSLPKVLRLCCASAEEKAKLGEELINASKAAQASTSTGSTSRSLEVRADGIQSPSEQLQVGA
jgi:hypothetical protein